MLSFIDTFFLRSISFIAFCCFFSSIFSFPSSKASFFAKIKVNFFQRLTLCVHMCLCNTRLNVYEKCDDSRKKRESLLRIDRFVATLFVPLCVWVCVCVPPTPFFLFFMNVPESQGLLAFLSLCF